MDLSVSGWSSPRCRVNKARAASSCSDAVRTSPRKKKERPSVSRSRAAISGWSANALSTYGRADSIAFPNVTARPRPPACPSGRRRREDPVLHESEYRLGLCLASQGVFFRRHLGGRGNQRRLFARVARTACQVAAAVPARRAAATTAAVSTAARFRLASFVSR